MALGFRFFRRLRWSVFCLLLAFLQVPASAQTPPHLRVGLGAAMSGDLLAGVGGHGSVEVSMRPDRRFDLRAGASFAAGEFRGPVGKVVWGLDLIGVATFGDQERPYFGLGLGYSHTDLSRDQPFSHDAGATWVGGLELAGPSGVWFLEIRHRVFGTTFRSGGITRAVLLLTIGKRIR